MFRIHFMDSALTFARACWISAVVIAVLASPAAAAAAPLPNTEVDSPKRPSLEELVRTSTLAAYGRFDTAHQSKVLRKQVNDRTLVNYSQNFHVYRYIKGSGPMVLEVLSTGVEPMPDAESPLNLTYPGPMAEGMYIVFFYDGESPFYLINGRWQGVYPMRDGKSIALQGAGFQELNGLTLDQFHAKVKEAER